MSWGWQTVISKPKITLSYLVTFWVVSYIYGFLVVLDVIPKLSEEESASNWLWFGLLFLLWVAVQGYLFEGLSKAALKIARGYSTRDTLFVSFPTLFEFIKLAVSSIFILVIFFIALVLIFPGIYFGLKYSQAYWIILEKRGKVQSSILSDKSAMKRSAELTKPKGTKLKILSISFVPVLIFSIISGILGNTDYVLAPILSDIVKHFSYVFEVFVMVYVYVQLNPKPETQVAHLDTAD